MEQSQSAQPKDSSSTDDTGLQLLASAGLLSSLTTATAATNSPNPTQPFASIPLGLPQPAATYDILCVRQQLQRELLLAQHQREIQRQCELLVLRNAVELQKQKAALLREINGSAKLNGPVISKSQNEAPVEVSTTTESCSKKSPLEISTKASGRKEPSKGPTPKAKSLEVESPAPKTKKRIARSKQEKVASRAPPKKRLKVHKLEPKALEIIDETNDRDVLSVPSRGRAYEPAGNTKFRKLVEKYHDFYLEADSKAEKTAVIGFIINEVHKTGGRFLRRHDCEFDLQEGVQWVELSPEERNRKTRDNLIRICATKKR